MFHHILSIDIGFNWHKHFYEMLMIITRVFSDLNLIVSNGVFFQEIRPVAVDSSRQAYMALVFKYGNRNQ